MQVEGEPYEIGLPEVFDKVVANSLGGGRLLYVYRKYD